MKFHGNPRWWSRNEIFGQTDRRKGGWRDTLADLTQIIGADRD
jgi:hypothetical protein